MYRVSYLYNGVFGFLVTVLIGYIVSLFVRKIWSRPIRQYDPNLFIPPLEKKLRKQQKDERFNLGNVPALSTSEEDLKRNNKTASRYS